MGCRSRELTAKAKETIFSRVPDAGWDSYLRSKIKPPALLSEIVYSVYATHCLAEVQIPASRVPKFRAGKALKEAVNG